MKYLIIISLLFLTPVLNAQEAEQELCEKKFLEKSKLIKSLMFGVDIKPVEEAGVKIYKWPANGSLMYTDKNGEKSLAYGECHIDINKKVITKLVFLNEFLVPEHNYKQVIKDKKKSLLKFMDVVNNDLGLTMEEFAWIVKYARKANIGIAGERQIALAYNLRRKRWINFVEDDFITQKNGLRTIFVLPTEQAWALHEAMNDSESSSMRKRAPIGDEGPGGPEPRPHPEGPNCYRDCQ